MSGVKINKEWAERFVSDHKKKSRSGGSEYRFVQLPKTGSMKFQLLPPDENGRIGKVVGNHWNMTDKDGKPSKALCVEATFPDVEGIRCPICEEIRNGQTAGAKTEDWEVSSQAYLEAVIHGGGSDDNGPFKTDEVVLLRVTEYSLIWVIQQLLDPDLGDWLDPKNSSIIKFEREKADGKWERKFLRATILGDEDNELKDKLLGIHEGIKLQEIWKIPNDEAMDEIAGMAKRVRKQIAVELAQKEKIKPAVNNEKAADKVGESVDKAMSKARDNHSKAPDGAPECFSDDSIYSDLSAKCLACPFQVDCEFAINKKKVGQDDMPF
jgi:hypothetical protein